MQNDLAIAEPQDPHSRRYYERSYRVIHAGRFVAAITAAIRDPDVLRVAEGGGPIGARDQWADSTDVLRHAPTCRRLGGLFAG